jgi:chromosome segregation ATPase
MWIESLRLRGYPPFEGEKTFLFARGRTVVTGPNASGKTRLVEAVRGTFFGFPEAAISEDGFTEVVFHLGSRSFVLRREFDSCRIILGERTNRGEEIRHDGGSTDPDAEERLRATLAALLGTSEDVWMSSGFVRDGILETHLDEAVRAWLVGNPQGDEEAILAQVEGDLARLSGVDGQSGELGGVRVEIAKRESLLAFWQESAADTAQAREAWQETEAARQAAALRAQEHQSIFESLERFDHLSQERGRVENVLVELREDRDRIRRHLEAEEQSRSLLETQYADFLNAPDDIEEGIHLWIESTNRLQSAERERARLNSATATIPPARVARNGVIAASGLGLLSWFAGMGAGEPKLGVFLFPLFASAGFAIVWALERSSERVRLAHAAERNRVEIECRESEASLEAARRALGKLAAVESPAAIRKQFRGYMEVQEKLERARSLAARLRPLSVIMDDYEEVLSQLQVLDTETRDLVAQARYLSGLDADLSALRNRVEMAQRERDEAKGEAERLTREAEDLRAQFEPVGGGHPEPGRVAEELETFRATLADLTRREAAARVAADMLREALHEYQEDHLERVAVRATQFFESLSQGQYRELRFAGGLEPEVRGEGAWIPVAGLSRAVRDQLFFALRLAVSEDGAGDRGLPLILDEPFRGWDEGRVEEARRLLGTLAGAGRQCIILGSDPRLLGWEGDCIRLERPDESVQALRAA